MADGAALSGYVINGPNAPLPGFESEINASIQPSPSAIYLADFPSYSWVFGCSAGSGAMIAAYYDRGAFPNTYAGPTNGGVMPLIDTSWSTWSDGMDTYPNNPLIASHNGVDGRTIKGSIDDYWISYGSGANDPYIIGGWPQHSWGGAIGDYMKTSQSAYDNSDGATTFYTWKTNPEPLTCADMVSNSIDDEDGTYGRKLFYEVRGYTVTDCYNQKTDNNGGGFSLADYKAEIDAGHPVLLNLEGHSIVGYGYDDSTIYIRDTWDNDPSQTHTMPWGGSYGGMNLLSVSVVKANVIITPPSPPTGISASDGTFTDRVQVTWSASTGATYYQVFRHTSNDSASATSLSSSHPSSPYIDTSAVAGTIYYYWIKACNSGGCSSYSVSDSGYRAVENQAPVADAGEDQTVGTNALVTLDGSTSYDPDSDLPLTYLWTQTNGTAVTLSDTTASNPTFTAPSDPEILIFSLAVTDSLGLASAADEVSITVENQTPVADAGEDQTVDTSALVTLDGSASSDPDGDLPLTFAWTQTGGLSALLDDQTLEKPSFTAPNSIAILTFSLVVTDDKGTSSVEDEVVIHVIGYFLYLPLVTK